MLVLKYVYPNDKVIDWVYQQLVGNDYKGLAISPSGWNNELISSLVFATDYNQNNSRDTALNDFKLSRLAPRRGLMLARSSFTDPDALFLAMHTRQNYGRHVQGDRNSFVLAGAGRLWARHDTHAFGTRSVSVIDIDDREQGIRTPGRVVDYVDTKLATIHVDSSRLSGGDKSSGHFNRTRWKAEGGSRHPNSKQTDKTLMIPTRAVNGTYKVLLYPYHHGQPLPTTRFSAESGQLTVTIGRRTQEISFTTAASGKTDIIVQEQGQSTMSLKRPLSEQPNR